MMIASLSKKVARAGIWIIALKATSRGIGILRTVVLARLLAPEDFGLLGIAILTVGILETFSSTGFNSALIQRGGSISKYLDTAWTISVIRGMVLASALYLLAPLSAAFFHSSDATRLIQVIALSVLMNGFRNVGMVFFEKDLEFQKKFLYELFSEVLNLLVSVLMAFYLRNVWALIWGRLSADFFRLLLSFMLHPHVPRFRLRLVEISELFGFGKWVFLSGVMVFLITQGDNLLVAKALGVSALGFYQMAFKLSNLAPTEIGQIISSITFPAYAKLQTDKTRLRTAYLRILQLTALVAMPLSGLIFSLSEEIVAIVLGSKWESIVPPMRILSLMGPLATIHATAWPVLLGVGKPKLDALWQVIRLIVLGILIYPFTTKWGLSGVSTAVFLSLLATTGGFCWMVIRAIDCSLQDFLMMIIAPFISSVSMVSVILYFKRWVIFQDAWWIIMFISGGMILYHALVLVIDRTFRFGIFVNVKESLRAI